MKAQSKPRKSRQAYAHSVIAQKPKILGWNTTDDDEIALRRWCGQTNFMKICLAFCGKRFDIQAERENSEYSESR